MADLFIIRKRLQFSLKLIVVGIGLGLLATWHFRSQLEFEPDHSRFYLSAVITGVLALGWVGLGLFYQAVKRVEDPSRHLTDGIDGLPWWVLKVALLVLVIGITGAYIYRQSLLLENEFDFIRDGKLAQLKEQVSASPEVLEKTETKEGITLVQMAFREGYHDAVGLLLELGATIEGMDAQNRNPLIVSLDNPQMLKVLLQSGMDPELPDAEGIPAIHYAVEAQGNAALQVLLEAGANIDARDKLFRTPLIRAAENNDLVMMRFLLEHAAAVNVYDRRGDTALHKVTRSRNLEGIHLLLSHAADPRIFNFIQMTPLHLAALGGHTDMVAIYLELPDMIGLKGEDNLTPFDHALTARKYSTAELLLEAGADINRFLANGDTELHKVITIRDYRTARFLIRAGADVQIPNAQGETVLDLLRRKQLSGLLDLVEARDNPDSVTNAVLEAAAP